MDELARDLADLAAGYLADGEPVAPGLPGPPAAHRDPEPVV
ncbi:hypothetical protein [Kitasatospora sp. NPDC006786]